MRAGEPAPFGGVLVTREFFDDLIAGGELGEAAEMALRGWRSAISLVELRGDRIEELEAKVSRQSWVARSIFALGGT